jgi:hypothetical protein
MVGALLRMVAAAATGELGDKLTFGSSRHGLARRPSRRYYMPRFAAEDLERSCDEPIWIWRRPNLKRAFEMIGAVFQPRSDGLRGTTAKSENDESLQSRATGVGDRPTQAQPAVLSRSTLVTSQRFADWRPGASSRDSSLGPRSWRRFRKLSRSSPADSAPSGSEAR